MRPALRMKSLRFDCIVQNACWTMFTSETLPEDWNQSAWALLSGAFRHVPGWIAGSRWRSQTKRLSRAIVDRGRLQALAPQRSSRNAHQASRSGSLNDVVLFRRDCYMGIDLHVIASGAVSTCSRDCSCMRALSWNKLGNAGSVAALQWARNGLLKGRSPCNFSRDALPRVWSIYHH